LRHCVIALGNRLVLFGLGDDDQTVTNSWDNISRHRTHLLVGRGTSLEAQEIIGKQALVDDAIDPTVGCRRAASNVQPSDDQVEAMTQALVRLNTRLVEAITPPVCLYRKSPWRITIPTWSMVGDRPSTLSQLTRTGHPGHHFGDGSEECSSRLRRENGRKSPFASENGIPTGAGGTKHSHDVCLKRISPSALRRIMRRHRTVMSLW
jgi:hypothetical protein